MATTAETDVSQLSFEAALARHEEIVRAVEKGEAPLDPTIEVYQEGVRRKRRRGSSRLPSAAMASRRG